MPSRLSIIGLLLLVVLTTVVSLNRRRASSLPTESLFANTELVDSTGTVLIDRTANPRPLRVYPLDNFSLDQPTRRRLLDVTVDSAARTGIAYESVVVHWLRLDQSARATEGFEHHWVFDEAFSLLTDDRQYRRYGTRLPLLVETPFGVAFRTHPQEDGNASVTMEMVGGVPHVDKVLSLPGELGYSLETPLTTHTGSAYTLADVLEDSLQRFSFDRELEWSLIAYTDYLTSQNSWRTSSGQVVTVSDIVERLIDRPEERGACRGTHRIYAIAKAHMRERLQPGFLTAHVAFQIEEYLHDLSIRLEHSQAPDGSWGSGWSEPRSVDSPITAVTTPDADHLLVTGHMLEWMAIVSDESRPSQQVIRRAATFIHERLLSDPEMWFNDHFFPATHALRALIHLSQAGH